MIQCVHLLVFLHGILMLQMEGVLGVSDESSDSSPGHRTSYYIFQMLPIQRLKGKPEKAFDMKTANLPALLPSSFRDAPGAMRPAVNLVAHLHPQWGPPVPRQSHSSSTLAPPLMENTALMDSTLTLSTQYKMLERNGDTSGPDVVGTRLAVSTGFSQAPPILVTSGLSTNGIVHNTIFPTSSTTQEPRGDM